MNKYFDEIKSILALSLPLMLSYIVSYGKNIIDTIMVGNVSNNDLVGLSLTSGIYFIMIVFTLGIATTATSIFSEHVAKKDYKALHHDVYQLIYLTFLVSIFALFVFCSASLIYNFLTLEQQTKDIATYSSIIMGFGFIPLAVTVVLRVVMVSMEKTHLLFNLSIFTFILNIILNYIFIKYLDWGAIGCTFATAGCFLLDMLMLVYCVNKNKNLNLLSNIPNPDWPKIKYWFKFGLPIGLAYGFDELLFILIAFLITRFGEVAVGSYYIIYGLISIILMFPVGLSNVMIHRVAFLNSAENHKKLEQSIISSLIISFILTVLIITIMLVFKQQIIGMYSHDKSIIDMTNSLFSIAIIYISLDTLVTVLGGLLKGLKYNKFIFKITTTCGWLIGFVVGHYLSYSNGVAGYLYGIILAYIVIVLLQGYKTYTSVWSKE